MSRSMIEAEPTAHAPRQNVATPMVLDPELGFERLHALARAGYLPQIGGDHVDSTIVLDHSGKGPRIRLFPDGTIQVLDRKVPIHGDVGKDPYRILPDDMQTFGKFARYLEGVPRKRKGRWGKRLLLFVLFFAFWALSISLTIGMAEGF